MLALDPLTVFLLFLFWPKKKVYGPAAGLLSAPGMSVFPVSISSASFSNDYNPPKHNGIDIFATKGTAVYAPEGGRVRFTTDPLGGNVFYLAGHSGTTYYGAHLTGFVGGDRTVKAGEQIGFVGATGNAKNTAPHLHFQVNGGKTDPYPLLRSLAPTAPQAPWARRENVA